MDCWLCRAITGAHESVVRVLGADTRLVRAPADLRDLDGLIIPGGESTTMARLCDRYELRAPLVEGIENGLPVLGTCAGLILLAREIEGGSSNFEQRPLGVLNARVARNAYGAQADSFETTLDVPLLGETIGAVFIRAPQIRALGAGVEALAWHEGVPVLVRQNAIIAAAFHPEIAGGNAGSPPVDGCDWRVSARALGARALGARALGARALGTRALGTGASIARLNRN